MPVLIAPELTGLVGAAVVALDAVVVRDHDGALGEAMQQAATAAAASAERADVTSAVRAMYRRVGIDPTKTRPSSEALLRRVRRGEALPRINTAVDVVNWCSLESQLPFGLYDRSAIRGAIVLRLGRAGEQYAGIRKDVVHVEGRLALADDQGPFGNPTSDSARTMVTTATRRLVVVIFAPAAIPAPVVQRALALTSERLIRYCGGTAARMDRDSPNGLDS